MAPSSEETHPPSEALVECRDIEKNFRIRDREIRALDGISLSVNRGEIAVVSGRSGAGKSTLLSMLGGLDRPTSGSVIFDGRHMEDLSNRDLALLRHTQIGMVFQSFNLLPSWTAVENVGAALIHAGLSRPERSEKACALLDDLGLGDRLGHLPSELSAGEQQRVAVARALANGPALVLADEPTGDVDAETAREVMDYLLGPVRESRVTLLIATHGIIPLDIADRVFRMSAGRLVPESGLST